MPLDTQRARIGWRCRTEALASVHAQTILGPPEIQREPHFRSGGKRTVCGLARPEGEGRLADRSCGRAIAVPPEPMATRGLGKSDPNVVPGHAGQNGGHWRALNTREFHNDP